MSTGTPARMSLDRPWRCVPDAAQAFLVLESYRVSQFSYKDARLCIGPALEDGGFYYDMHLEEEKVVPEDFTVVESVMQKAVSEKQPFVRLVLTKEEALEMFKVGSWWYRCSILTVSLPV